MKKMILCGMVAVALTGCGKSQEQIEKEKQAQIAAQNAKIEAEKKAKDEAELKANEEIVKYYLKDGESARFRNVVKNCGEVNSKNSWGAYAGFSRFVVTKDKQVIFENPNNYYFDYLVKENCDKEYLKKFPVNIQSANTPAIDAMVPAADAAGMASRDTEAAATNAAEDANELTKRPNKKRIAIEPAEQEYSSEIAEKSDTSEAN